MQQESPKKKNHKNRTLSERFYLFLVKWPKRILILLIFSVLFIFAALQLPATQNYIKNKTIAKLEKDLQTHISISDFKFSILNGFYLKNLIIEDQDQDTLLQAKKLQVTLDRGIFSLFYNNLYIQDIELSGASVQLKRTKNSASHNAQFILDYFKTDSSRKKKKISLALKSINLHDVQLHSQNDISHKNFDAYAFQGKILVDSLNLEQNYFAIQSVHVLNPRFSFFKHKQDTTTILSNLTKEQDTNDLLLTIQNVHIEKGQFSSDNFDKSFSRDSIKKLVDFNHLDVSAINIKIKNFSFDKKAFSGSIQNLSLVENSGFEIEKLSVKQATISNRKTELIGFKFQTPNEHKDQKGTYLTHYLALKYKSYEDFNSFKDKVYVKLKLQESKIAIRDILYFAKKLQTKKFFQLNKNQSVLVSGDFAGKLENPRANNLNISIGQTAMIGKIKINNLSDKAHASINIDVQEIRTDIPTLKLLIPGFNPPSNLNALGKLTFKGKLEGFVNQFVAYGELKTAIGAVKADMNLDISNGTEKAKYSGKLSVIDFDLNKWMSNEELGLISFNAVVKEGGGIRLHTAHAVLHGSIERFEYKKYIYQDIVLNGKLEQNFFDGKLKSSDPNINLDFIGQVDFTDSIAKYNFDSEIRSLNLYALNLSKQPLNVVGSIDLNLSGKELKEFSGNAQIKGLKLFNKQDSFQLDSAYIAVKLDDPNNKYLKIQSSIINANMKGVFDLQSLPIALKSALISRSPAFAKKLNINPDSLRAKKQDFTFDLELHNSQNITQLIGLNIDTIAGVKLKGTFNNQAELLKINGHISSIHAGNKSINNTEISINGKPNILKAKANIFEIQLNEKKSLPPIAINISVFPDTLDFNIKASNISSVLKNVRFNGIVLPKKDYYQLQFSPSNIHLAEDNWQISSNNYLRFSKNFLEAKNINFTSKEKQFELSTPTSNSLHLDFKHFDLSFINSLYAYDKLLYSGPFVANIQFNNIQERKDIRLEMKADNINFNAEAYGSFLLKANMPDFHSPVDVDLNIGKGLLTTTGYVHFAKASSTWKGQKVPKKSIFLDGNLKNFPFPIIEDIIPNGISETAGKFDGHLSIKGPLTGPEFDGYADILNGEMTIDYMKTHYFINHQRLLINTTQFNATGAKITDRLGNTAGIVGGLRHRRFKNFSLDVVMLSDRFLVLDTKKGDDPLYYGTAIADVTAKFSGNFEQPKLRIVGTSLHGTNLNLVFSHEQQVGENKFVKFLSFAKEAEEKKYQDEEVSNAATGLNIDMTFNFTEDADMKLIFDETAGDVIQSHGSGEFNLQYKRSGEFFMNGQYVISKGEYLFTLLNFINKPFVIKPGGTITWSKDPMGAILDIQAVYQGLKAPIQNLIKEELKAFGTKSDVTEAQKPTNINLGLLLTGPMMQPNISFSLDIPNLIGNNKNYVSSKLNNIQNDPNELNRQVIGLLVFGTFLPPGNSLGIEGNVGTGLTSTLSELLSIQFARHINSLLADVVGTGKIYSGMEVDLGVNIYQEDAAVGEDAITSRVFNINLKNHFFNNRVTVQLGGNFDISANNPINTTATSDFAGDILIEVILSKNRRYRMQVYNRFEPDYTTGSKNRRKTGFGLSYKREFNSFSDLFKGMKEAIGSQNQ